MKKNTLTRLLALCLALVCLVGTAAAAGLVWDLSGDGRTNVWDLQLAAEKEKTAEELAAALAEALGGADELHPNANGVYEIHSLVGLNHMIKNAGKGYSFKLMQDLDLKNRNWTPVHLYGIFDGNGHTISNVTITQSVYSGSAYVSGFFGTLYRYEDAGVTKQSQVKDLHLENVNVTADTNARYMGLLAGSSKGIIENCTATGAVTDLRTQLPSDTYVGALVGCNENSTPASKLIKGTDLLTATTGSDNPLDKVDGISAKLATFFAPLSYPEDATSKPARTLGGIAGFSNKANIDTTMLWQDTSNSTAYKSVEEQGYRNTVEQRMYQMGTVKWTPSETIYYLKNDNPTFSHSNVFVAGRTYTGIPYVGGYNGTYERFMSQMQPQKDDQGRYVTVTGLEEVSTQKDGVWTGAMRYIGNNCSWAVGWSWAAVSPSRVENGYGGVQGYSADAMVPNAYNIEKHGIVPVGGYQYPQSDTTKYSACEDVRDTRQIIALNGGAEGMAEYYAQASKGDAIVYDEYKESNGTYSNVNAHVRMLAADPVIIRNYQTKIDLASSYVITHEQGDGLSDNRNAEGKYDTYNGYNVKPTSWRIYHKYPLNVLLTEEAYKAVREPGYKSKETWPGCGWGYVPITMSAFTRSTQKAPYYNPYPATSENAVVLPSKGYIYSNYWTISLHMTITDAEGNKVFDETSFLMDRKTNGFSTIKLDKEFPEVPGLTAGQTYYCTLTALAGNGTVNTIYKNQAFTVTE